MKMLAVEKLREIVFCIQFESRTTEFPHELDSGCKKKR